MPGRLHFDYNCFHDHARASADECCTAGRAHVDSTSRATTTAARSVTLPVDEDVVATARIPKLLFVLSSLGMDLGRSKAPINDDYQAPFVYPGRCTKVAFELGDKASHRRDQGRRARRDDTPMTPPPQ